MGDTVSLSHPVTPTLVTPLNDATTLSSGMEKPRFLEEKKLFRFLFFRFQRFLKDF